MKTIAKTLSCLIFIFSFTVSSWAQPFAIATTDLSKSGGSFESTADLRAMLELLQEVPPVPFANLSKQQKTGTFWSFQNPEQPPLPDNLHGVDVWSLGERIFVIDDRQLDYAELAALAEAEAIASTKDTFKSGIGKLMARSAVAAFAYGNPVYLTNLVVSALSNQMMSASFSIRGGTNFVPYDILMSTNVATSVPQWNWLGTGYTSNSYAFSGQSSNRAFYILSKPSKTMTVAWGDNTYGKSDVPTGITNAVMVAGDYQHSLTLLGNGTVVGWGNSYIYGVLPTNLTGVVMVAAGWNHSVVLLTNGSVQAWGHDFYGNTNVPTNLTNAMVISAQALNSLALRSNGTVVVWGDSSSAQTNIPSGLSNVVAIASGGRHNLAVKSDGSVVAWGNNTYGQTNVPGGLNNVWDVAAGYYHSVALKKDGTVVAWGDNTYGQTNVPASLSNVVAIAAGANIQSSPFSAYTLALKSDGTLVAWGSSKVVTALGGIRNVIALGGGADNALAICTGPALPAIVAQPVDQYQIAGSNTTFTAKAQALYGVGYQWQFNGVNVSGVTNASLTLTNVQSAQQGSYHAVVSNEVGTVTSSNASFVLVTPPIITFPTAATNVVPIFNATHTLTPTVTAPGQTNGFPLTYQWLLNGTNLNGATASNYSFFAAAMALGNYSVLVTNAAGRTTSAVWQVTTTTYAGSYIDVGTLAYHLSTNAVGRTNGFTGSDADVAQFTNWVNSAYFGTNVSALTNIKWSTNFWLKGVRGLSASSMSLSNTGNWEVTMVSPRHFLCAFHVNQFGVFSNSPIAFLDTNNVIYWRKMIQCVDFSGGYNPGPDITVGILDSDLPSAVGFLPVLPTNYMLYLPANGASYVQGVGMNQFMGVFGRSLRIGNIGGASGISWAISGNAPYGLTTNWNRPTISGDSSTPVRLLIGNQFVLAAHTYGAGLGPNYSYYFDTINQTMHYLSTNTGVASSNYQLTTISLTNWSMISQ